MIVIRVVPTKFSLDQRKVSSALYFATQKTAQSTNKKK